MKFKYTSSTALDTKGRFTKRPLLQLELTTKEGRKIYPLALVDSGADQTLVNIQYADILGIDLRAAKNRPVGGIDPGANLTKVAAFPIKPAQMNEEIIVPACFIDSPNVDILIGQEGFFDTYRVKFEKDHDVFEIAKSNRK